jgi:hypothetical protein
MLLFMPERIYTSCYGFLGVPQIPEPPQFHTHFLRRTPCIVA